MLKKFIFPQFSRLWCNIVLLIALGKPVRVIKRNRMPSFIYHDTYFTICKEHALRLKLYLSQPIRPHPWGSVIDLYRISFGFKWHQHHPLMSRTALTKIGEIQIVFWVSSQITFSLWFHITPCLLVTHFFSFSSMFDVYWCM